MSLYIDKDSFIYSLITVVANNNINIESSLLKFASSFGIHVHPKFDISLAISRQIQKIIETLANSKITDKGLIKRNDTGKQIEKLGEGGFGTVYKYYNPLDKNYYAVKRVDLETSSINEVCILSKLHHKNIITYFFSWLDNSIINIHMELCIATLHDYFTFRTKNDTIFTDLVYIGLQIQDGVEYLHANKIIHGDLSSANILITNKFEIKISDFGLSRIYPDLAIEKDHGNPLYRAPEVNTGSIDFKSDIYSLGIIFIELFNFLKTRAQLVSILKTKKLVSTFVPGNLVEPFKNLIKKMLEKRISKRLDICQVKLIFAKLFKFIQN